MLINCAGWLGPDVIIFPNRVELLLALPLNPHIHFLGPVDLSFLVSLPVDFLSPPVVVGVIVFTQLMYVKLNTMCAMRFNWRYATVNSLRLTICLK